LKLNLRYYFPFYDNDTEPQHKKRNPEAPYSAGKEVLLEVKYCKILVHVHIPLNKVHNKTHNINMELSIVLA